MLRLQELRLPLDHPADALHAAAAARLGTEPDQLRAVHVARRGYDARRRGAIQLVYTLDVEVADEAALLARGAAPTPDTSYRFVAHAPAGLRTRPVVVGAGPCGLLAALVLAQGGFRPVVIERGQPVRQRTQDTWGLWRRGVLKSESNVQFGEGGAGTFSDGKLWSGISDPRRLGRKVLDEFVRAGAPGEILVNSKPHIGTFRLVSMVEKMRAEIEQLGGTYRFGTRVDGWEVEDGALRALHLSTGERLEATYVVLAPGHSARDTFAALHEAGVAMEAKPFSVGVRIEHPQGMIDRARFGAQAGHKVLGAADYKLVHHGRERSVYSFCMCPGGTVVAAASEPGRLVTNGMSQYSRSERNANAGIVVGLSPADYTLGPRAGTPLAGIDFQRHWEERAFAAGGGTYAAPGQRVGDFLAGRPSTTLGAVVPSYRPGVVPADLRECLPAFVADAIREALPAFDRQIPGFALPDAVLTGVETRTSSPLRILRGADGQNPGVRGLFPAGEGAGFAGGILSAAVDGIRAAEAVARTLAEQPAA